MRVFLLQKQKDCGKKTQEPGTLQIKDILYQRLIIRGRLEWGHSILSMAAIRKIFNFFVNDGGQKRNLDTENMGLPWLFPIAGISCRLNSSSL